MICYKFITEYCSGDALCSRIHFATYYLRVAELILHADGQPLGPRPCLPLSVPLRNKGRGCLFVLVIAGR